MRYFRKVLCFINIHEGGETTVVASGRRGWVYTYRCNACGEQQVVMGSL